MDVTQIIQKIEPVMATGEPMLFVVTVQGRLTPEAMENLRQSVRRVKSEMKIGSDIPWMILDDSTQVQLFRRDADAICTTTTQTKGQGPQEDRQQEASP